MLNKILLLGYATCSELNVKLLSKDWGNTDFEKEDYTKHQFNLNVSLFTISGFSSGGYVAANLMDMYNENIDGLGILSGDGPCAARKL